MGGHRKLVENLMMGWSRVNFKNTLKVYQFYYHLAESFLIYAFKVFRIIDHKLQFIEWFKKMHNGHKPAKSRSRFDAVFLGWSYPK